MRKLLAIALALVLFLSLTGLAAAFTVGQIQGQVEVKESLTVSQSQFKIGGYPGGVYTYSFQVTNHSPLPVAAHITTQGNGPFALQLRDSNVVVPPNGVYNGYVNVAIRPDATPGTYTVLIQVDR